MIKIPWTLIKTLLKFLLSFANPSKLILIEGFHIYFQRDSLVFICFPVFSAKKTIDRNPFEKSNKSKMSIIFIKILVIN